MKQRSSLHPTKKRIGHLKETVTLLKKAQLNRTARRRLVEEAGSATAKKKAQWRVTAITSINKAQILAKRAPSKLTGKQRFIIDLMKLESPQLPKNELIEILATAESEFQRYSEQYYKHHNRELDSQSEYSWMDCTYLALQHCKYKFKGTSVEPKIQDLLNQMRNNQY
jgi:hypothetical protein